MKKFNNNEFHRRFLRWAYKIAPFNIKGGWEACHKASNDTIICSCLIISNRPKELDLLLEDMCWQTLENSKFEIIVLNDGAGDSLRQVVDKYKERLNIIYRENQESSRILSNLRNDTLALSNGEYILFLDDDTRLFQKDLLVTAVKLFKSLDADVILPSANALYGIINVKYDYLDRYSFACRCCFYRRKVLDELGGFKENLNCSEDVELSMRIMIKNFNVFEADELEYLHPPLYFHTMRKALSTGQAIFQMRSHYSFFVWLLVYLHTLRFLPYGFSFNKVSRQWSKISLGLLLFPFTGKSYYY